MLIGVDLNGYVEDNSDVCGIIMMKIHISGLRCESEVKTFVYFNITVCSKSSFFKTG